MWINPYVDKCQKQNKQESQKVSSFPADDHKAARNRQDSTQRQARNITYKKDPQKKHVSKTSLDGWKGLTSWLLLVMSNCDCVTFPCGILGQVWYLIVLIPDLCRPSYFKLIGWSRSGSPLFLMWIKTHICWYA